MKNQDKYRVESEIESSQVKQQSKPDKSINESKAQSQYTPSKLNSLSFDINSNPYSQIAIDAKLLQAGSAGAGTVQLGLT